MNFLQKLNSKSAILIIAIGYLALALAFPSSWNKKKIITSDAVVYYQYLTAAFQFNDLSFDFAYELPEDFDGEIWINRTENGYKSTKVTMGVAIMMTPTYLLAQLINKAFGLGSYGYSPLFQFMVFLGALIYSLLGFHFLRKTLLRYFSDWVTLLTLLALGLGTNLMYYVSLEPGMSHAYSFFLFSALLYFTVQWHGRSNRSAVLKIGIILALITLIRPSNLLVILIPLLYGIYSLESLKVKWHLISTKWLDLLLAITLGLAVLALQLVFWKHFSGTFIYYGYGDEEFFWTEPKIAEVLFGFRKGLFVYTPVLLLATIGLFIRNKHLKAFKTPILLSLFLNVYLMASWWCWWFGGSFGMRPIIEFIPFLALGLAAFIHFLVKRKRLVKPAGVMVVGFILLNSFQTLQYKRGIIHYDSNTASSYWSNFLNFGQKPVNYDLLESPDYEEAKKGIGR